MTHIDSNILTQISKLTKEINMTKKKKKEKKNANIYTIDIYIKPLRQAKQMILACKHYKHRLSNQFMN